MRWPGHLLRGVAVAVGVYVIGAGMSWAAALVAYAPWSFSNFFLHLSVSQSVSQSVSTSSVVCLFVCLFVRARACVCCLCCPSVLV